MKHKSILEYTDEEFAHLVNKIVNIDFTNKYTLQAAFTYRY